MHEKGIQIQDFKRQSNCCMETKFECTKQTTDQFVQGKSFGSKAFQVSTEACLRNTIY